MRKSFLLLIVIAITAIIPTAFATTYGPTEYLHLMKKSKILAKTNSNDGILPGMGYAADTQSIAPAICFNPVTVTKTGQNSSVNFDLAESVAQIASDFNISADLGGGFGLFSASAMFDYLNQEQDDSYSLSLNYAQKVYDTVNMTYSYAPQTMLSTVGEDIYQNGQNPMFRLFCGDTLVTSYEEGAALIMTLKITFADKTQKETFSAHIGGGISGFFNAATQVQLIANQYHLNGHIHVSAFQLGGDPTQLSKVLSADLITCNINDIVKCQAAATALIKYANTTFPAEFEKEGSVWTSPLVPLGGYTKGYKVSDIGLTLAPSYVTQDVLDSRQALVTAYTNNQIDNAGFTQILNLYPVVLNSAFTSKIQANRNVALANLGLLQQGINGEGPASDCWLFPFNCKQVASNLLIHLQPMPMDTNELSSYLGPIIKIQYYGGTFWPNGYVKNTGTTTSLGYFSYTPPYEQGWNVFSINSAQGMLQLGSSMYFSGSGTYHDGGACPMDDNFNFQVTYPMNDSSGKGNINRHIHSSGGCHWDGDKLDQNILFLVQANPYAFNIPMPAGGRMGIH